ncbi:MAG TPA: hypothetical protein GX730_02245, partial [Chloroflexi bacterium]|nr:hypothetical protein [Chloroflexota bacterium]
MMTEVTLQPQLIRLGLSLSPRQVQRNNLAEVFPKKPTSRVEFLRNLRKIDHFSRVFGRIRLRHYQLEVAQAIVESVFRQQGLSIVVMFPRQSGKNLLQAQLEVYLMALLGTQGAEM